jgi:hypothetical protein
MHSLPSLFTASKDYIFVQPLPSSITRKFKAERISNSMDSNHEVTDRAILVASKAQVLYLLVTYRRCVRAIHTGTLIDCISRNSFGSDFVVRDPGFCLGFLICYFFFWRKQNSKIPSRCEDRPSSEKFISDAMSESFMGRRHLL